MRRYSSWHFFLWVALSFWALAPLAAQEPIGRIERLQGEALALYGDQQRTLQVGSALFPEEIIRTSADTRLRAVLNDGSGMVLGSSAELRLDEFVYNPQAGEGKLGIDCLQGAFQFVSGEIKTLENSEMRLVTPMAVLGVRGTRFWGGEIDGSYGILVLEGEVEVSNFSGSVVLREGEGTSIALLEEVPADNMRRDPSLMSWVLDRAAGPPGAVNTWSGDKVARAVATVSFDAP